MKSFKIFLILALAPYSMLAQFNLEVNKSTPIDFTLGIGISSQYTRQVSPLLKFSTHYNVAPKMQVFGSASCTFNSKGDTFSLIDQSFYNNGQIVASNYSKTSLTTFSMMDFSLGFRFIPHKRVALRIAPALTQLYKGEYTKINREIKLNGSRGGSGTRTINSSDFVGINNSLLGIDLGFDISLFKWLTLDYISYLRFTDVTNDEVYGPRKDKIMQSTLSLNYVIK